MLTYFATFGSGHPLENHYVGIVAESEEQARHAMFKTFADKWAFLYQANAPEGGLREQESRFKLTPALFLSVVPHSYKNEPLILAVDREHFETAYGIDSRYSSRRAAI